MQPVRFIALPVAGLLFVLSACTPATSGQEHPSPSASSRTAERPAPDVDKSGESVREHPEERIRETYRGVTPKEWGEQVRGVITRFETKEPLIALTFDACGGPRGSKFDQALVDHLIREQIPATLFVNSRWIDANRDTFLRLSENPLFEIGNHGTEHRPLSVNGRSVYGIRGTSDPAHAFREVWLNHEKIRNLTGREPKFFRAGTAYYDEVAVRIVHETGERVAGFDVVGDGGARFSASQVKQALLSAKPGSIVILHFNQPNGETFEGLRQAIPVLKQRGFRFVKLEDVL
ncbi:polysaccharide deacetylase family protein [Staphylospora marina]|uniref:polysaccharide deacetylase family protein n=1 Tax=Staphylospora marina TaxID=2490858 RepID=UPI000F5BF93B|nr:polysaccharide deacetylase family protein [Staphylospora marina]